MRANLEMWVALSAPLALPPSYALAAHCPYETLWGQELQINGSWPEEWVHVDYGAGLHDTCRLSLAGKVPHLEEVSGWMPAGIAICPEWTTSLTLLSPGANQDAHPSIAVFDGNVFYETCPSDRQKITRLGALLRQGRE